MPPGHTLTVDVEDTDGWKGIDEALFLDPVDGNMVAFGRYTNRGAQSSPVVFTLLGTYGTRGGYTITTRTGPLEPCPIDAAAKGSVESCWTTPGYHTGKYPGLAFATTVPFGPQIGDREPAVLRAADVSPVKLVRQDLNPDRVEGDPARSRRLDGDGLALLRAAGESHRPIR